MTACNVNVKKQDDVQVREFLPAADIYERIDAYVIEASVPGADPETLQVQVQDGVLRVRATVAVEVPEGHEVLHRGYVGGDYVRSFRLPREVDAGDIMARIRNGILTVSLPKKAEAKPRQVEVVAE